MKIRRQMFVLLTALPFLLACKVENDISMPPTNLPFEVQKAGNKVEILMKITKCDVYGFSLRFGYKENDKLDRERVRRLVGGYEIDKMTGQAREPGIPTPVRLRIIEISKVGERLVFEKEVAPILTSWGANSFGKQIGRTLLQPGVYRISLEALTDAPEYSDIPVRLAIGANPKAYPSKSICQN